MYSFSFLIQLCLVQLEIIVLPKPSIQHPWRLANCWRALPSEFTLFEHAIPPPPGPIADVGANGATPTLLSVNVDQPTQPTAFSEVQITQLRSLISAVVHRERVGTPQLPVQVESSPLSPATPQPPPPSRAIPTSTINFPNNAVAAQDGVGLTQTPGPSLPSTSVAATPGTSAPAHNLPPIPQKNTAAHCQT